jgi:predicted nucleic acid-binding Zn ribbon protein
MGTRLSSRNTIFTAFILDFPKDCDKVLNMKDNKDTFFSQDKCDRCKIEIEKLLNDNGIQTKGTK